MQPRFKPPRPLRDYVADLPSWCDAGWLYVADDDRQITLDTPCHLRDWDDLELSEEEQNDIADQIPGLGLREFFEWGQLEDIVENLREQRPDFSEDDLERAIQFYYEWDAFIDLEADD
jgi:hypothetical protein